MHNWFFFSLVAPVLWAVVNHVDKYLLSKHFKNSGVGSIFLFSSLFSIFVLPIIYFFLPSNSLVIPFSEIITLVFVGVLSATAFFFYLKALEIEESSVVIPLLQMIPLFGYLLAYPILGEVLNKQQLLASIIIIIGIIILSLEFDSDNHLTLKKKVLCFIALSSFLFALHDVLFKYIALESNFTISIFWQYIGMFLSGVAIFIFSKVYREHFLDTFRQNRYLVIFLNIGSESLYLLGNIANNFATLLAPVAIVLVVGSSQPLFVFVGGILLTLFLPRIATEKMTNRHLIQKLLSIVIIIIGSYLLYSAGS